MKRSQPSITSAGEPWSFSGFEFSAYQRLISLISPEA